MRKAELRHKFRQIKRTLLTWHNDNSYHSHLLNSLDVVLNRSLGGQKLDRQFKIGSYINRPISQIIPPSPAQLSLGSNMVSMRYAFPCFSKQERNLRFFQHHPHTRYRMGDYGIKVNADPSHHVQVSGDLDAVLVPLVSFNSGKLRIGEGGGYYDAFIRRTRSGQNRSTRNQILFIGVGLEGLRMEDVGEVFEEWDEPLDYIITEKGVYT